MTRFILLPTMFAVVTIVGVAFTDASHGNSACPGESCNKEAGKCGQHAGEKTKSCCAKGKAGCCLLDAASDKAAADATAAKDATAKASTCNEEACKESKGQCEFCATAAGKGDKKKASKATTEKADVVAGKKGTPAAAGRGPGGRGRGRGMGPGRGHGPGMMGRGPGAMEGMREDMTTLHAMFADKNKIRRKVKNLPNGAVAVTESDDEKIADLLREHVPAMEDRVHGNTPLPPMTFHPIFVELIKHADDYDLVYEDTDKGIKATYTSDDPEVVKLVQEHAKLVSRFIKNGMGEIHKPYKFPKDKADAKVKSKDKPLASAPAKKPKK